MVAHLRVVAVAFVLGLIASSCGNQMGVLPIPCDGVCGDGTTCNEATNRCDPVVTGSGGGSGSGAGGGAAQTGLPCDVARVFSQKCESCHGATLTNGAPVELDRPADFLQKSNLYPDQTFAQRSLARVKDSANPMPPAWTGQSLTAAEVDTLTTWVNSNMPGGTCTVTDTSGSGGGAGGGSGNGGGAGGGSAGGGSAGGGSAGGGSAGGGSAGGGSAGGGHGGGSAGGGAGGGHGGGAGGGGGGSSAYCKPCADSTTCGGASNFCLGFSFGNYCGTDCSAGQSCGASARCVTITDGNGTTIGKNCVPLSGQTCGGSGGGGGGSGGGAGGGGSGGGAGGCGVDTWSNYAQSFFNTTCNSCHTHTGEFISQSYVRSIKTSITSRINSGSMPQGRTLSSAERTRIINYMNCNAP